MHTYASVSMTEGDVSSTLERIDRDSDDGGKRRKYVNMVHTACGASYRIRKCDRTTSSSWFATPTTNQ